MPKKAADGGGNFLGTRGLVALADANAVVLAQRVERLENFKSDKPEHKQYAPSVQIRANILVISSDGGARDGEFWPDQDLISAGWTRKLDDDVAEDGEVIAGRTATYGGGKACLNAPSGPEYAAVEKFYRDKGLDPTDPTADADLFAQLRKAHAAEQRDGVREKVGAVSGAKGASAADDDDLPPF